MTLTYYAAEKVSRIQRDGRGQARSSRLRYLAWNLATKIFAQCHLRRPIKTLPHEASATERDDEDARRPPPAS